LPEFKDGKPTGAYTINPDIVAMGLSPCSLYLVWYIKKEKSLALGGAFMKCL